MSKLNKETWNRGRKNKWSKDWIKDADYAEVVIQHVINLGNTDEFVPVPPGETIHIHTNHICTEIQTCWSEGDDLCVLKSLASAILRVIGFVESINHYGESQLRGGTVDAVRKVGQYAETQLPQWITKKVMHLE